jgi:hypothetical protein
MWMRAEGSLLTRSKALVVVGLGAVSGRTVDP